MKNLTGSTAEAQLILGIARFVAAEDAGTSSDACMSAYYSAQKLRNELLTLRLAKYNH